MHAVQNCVLQSEFNSAVCAKGGFSMITRSYPKQTEGRNRCTGVSLFGILGGVLAALLLLGTFRERVMLTEYSDRVSVVRAELSELEEERESLIVARETAISLEELEEYALNVLGMVHPDARNLRWMTIGG